MARSQFCEQCLRQGYHTDWCPSVNFFVQQAWNFTKGLLTPFDKNFLYVHRIQIPERQNEPES